MNLLLPVGSIVSLENKRGKLMIIGYYGIDDKQTKEYIGCNFPSGMCTKRRVYFNTEDINVLYFVGGQTTDSINYRVILKEQMEQLLSGEKDMLTLMMESREKYLGEDPKELKKILKDIKEEDERAKDGDNSINRDGFEILDESNILIPQTFAEKEEK